MGGWALSFDARRRRAGCRDAGRDETAGLAPGGARRLSQKCHARDYNAARGRMKAVRPTIRRCAASGATPAHELDWNRGRCVTACRPGEDRPAMPTTVLSRRHRCDERRETARRRCADASRFRMAAAYRLRA
ncbi:hypothetical protein DF024_05045 [Burkholderia cenocepacia]|nr:hypothetical protein DF024_05045 [Burkholderia cenocepacia]